MITKKADKLKTAVKKSNRKTENWLRVGKIKFYKMKKVFLVCAIGLSILALPAFSTIKSSKATNLENGDCQYGQCSKIKADGYQCKNCAQKGNYYCWSHRD